MHGASGLTQAEEASAILFSGGAFDGFGARELRALFHEVPSTQLSDTDVVGKAALDVAVMCGACKSKGDAKRLIKNGGLYVNNHRVTSVDEVVPPASLIEGQVCVVRTGKKNYFLITVRP